MKEQHQNKVELLGHYGGDLQHAMSAWTSTQEALRLKSKSNHPFLMLANRSLREKSSLLATRKELPPLLARWPTQGERACEHHCR